MNKEVRSIINQINCIFWSRVYDRERKYHISNYQAIGDELKATFVGISSKTLDNVRNYYYYHLFQ